MSSNQLFLIPDVPEYAPNQSAARQARDFLKSVLPDADEVKSELNDALIFVDPGANLELVACPQCGRNAGKWWGEALQNYRRNGAAAFVVVTPCCGKRTSLDGLHYRPTAGFARFVLSAHNPVRAITRKERQQLSRLVGCNLREVSAVV
ncbi:MAG: hypothetical protein KGL40_02025 [Rhodocyclaceae bacterium]|nr:hypothetical protein [Rhodocyclaceae bacterium]